MQFSTNHPILFVLVAIIILAVVAQSVFFLMRALRRAKEIGMDMQKVKKIIRSSAIFTIAPAVAILVGVVTLSKTLGTPLPWLRLSVIGSLSYEAIAANNTLEAMGLKMGAILNASQYVTIAFVMTISILVGIWLAPLIGRRLQNGMASLEKRDKKWGETITNAMFIGMISAFVGFVFCDFSFVFQGDFSGLIPVFVMLVSAVVMTVAGLLATKLKIRWLTEYALPMSLICGMAAAIPLTAWLS